MQCARIEFRSYSKIPSALNNRYVLVEMMCVGRHDFAGHLFDPDNERFSRDPWIPKDALSTIREGLQRREDWRVA